MQAQHHPSPPARHLAFKGLYAWALCFGSTLMVTQIHAQESEQGAAWISDAEHLRMILPRLSTRATTAAVAAARSSRESATVAKALPAATTDIAEVLAGPMLQRPAHAARARWANGRARQMTPEMAQMLQRASRQFAVDVHLVQAVMHAESAFNPRAVSPRNAIGLMQVLPSTARDLGLQDLQGRSVEQLLTDPRVSIVLGTKYLATQLARFDGNVELALAAYNAGPGAVIRAGHRVPNYRETRHYVRRVLGLARAYRRFNQQAEPT